MSHHWIAVDGELIPSQEAAVGALEGGASIGWGVFSTGAVVRGRPILLTRHINRLQRDAVRSRLAEEGFEAGWSEDLARVIAANEIERGVFRLTLCARGEGRWHEAGAPRRLVAALPSSLGAAPERVWLSPYRLDARRPLAGVKSTSYAPWQAMWLEARELGFTEAIYRDSNGALCEGARSSLFWRRGRAILTPSPGTGCLPGIARGLLCEWLREGASEWSLREVHLAPEALSGADEAFLCSATLGPRPVERIEGQGFRWEPSGEGDACAMLRARWDALAE